MTDKPDGGPAYPVAASRDYAPGMSLRQHIVIELVAALISYEGPHTEGYEKSHIEIAERYADAMISEDKKSPNPQPVLATIKARSRQPASTLPTCLTKPSCG